jgi:uncharacterized membrane protein
VGHGWIPGNWGNSYGMMGVYGYHSLVHMITMVLSWILLGLGIAVLVKWLRKSK